MTIDQPLRDLLANVAEPFASARAMPPGVYTSEDFLQRELDAIFAREWVCLGRADALAAPGDYLTYDLAGEPLFVMRDAEGRLRALSNVCRHRMSTLLEGAGNRRAIVCPYHGWSYNLDGSLRGAPAMEGNRAFCKEDYRLPEIRCEQWLGFVMATLNPQARPVAERLSEVQALIDDYAIEHYVETFRETHVWDTNWKILAENFMESYHLPVCHAGTIGGLSRLSEMVCPPGRARLQLSHDPQGRLAEDRARPSRQHAHAGRAAPHHLPARGLSEPAGHADARLFLVPLAASARAGPGRYRVRRRHVARIRPLGGGQGAIRS